MNPMMQTSDVSEGVNPITDRRRVLQCGLCTVLLYCVYRPARQWSTGLQGCVVVVIQRYAPSGCMLPTNPRYPPAPGSCTCTCTAGVSSLAQARAQDGQEEEDRTGQDRMEPKDAGPRPRTPDTRHPTLAVAPVPSPQPALALQVALIGRASPALCPESPSSRLSSSGALRCAAERLLLLLSCACPAPALLLLLPLLCLRSCFRAAAAPCSVRTLTSPSHLTLTRTLRPVSSELHCLV